MHIQINNYKWLKKTGPTLLINNYLQNYSAVQSDKMYLQTGWGNVQGMLQSIPFPKEQMLPGNVPFTSILFSNSKVYFLISFRVHHRV